MKSRRLDNHQELHSTRPSALSLVQPEPCLVIFVIAKLSQLNALIDASAKPWTTSQIIRVLVINQDILSDVSRDDMSFFDQVIPVSTRKERALFPEFYPDQIRRVFMSQQEHYAFKETLVFCGCEGNITHVAEAIDGLSIKGFSAYKAILFRDKTLMKAFVQSHGVPVPKFIADVQGKTFSELAAILGIPFVMKPVDEGGSFGFHLIHNEVDYLNALKSIHCIDSYQAETYLDGELFHVDSVKCLGESPISLVSEYLFPAAQCLDGMPAGSIALEQQSSIAQKILSVHHQVLEAFNVPGIFHAEYFITSKGQVVFLEIAWRCSGPPCDVNFHQYAGTTQNTTYLGLATGVLTKKDLLFHQPLSMRVLITLQPGSYQQLSIPLPKAAYTVLEESPKGTVCERGVTYLCNVAIIDVHAESPEKLREYFLALRRAGQSLAVFAP